MLVQSLLASALCGALAYGFQDTSPLFAFVSSASHSVSPFPPIDEQLASGSSIVRSLSVALETCPTDVYILVSQPSVSAQDFSIRDSAPHLYKMLSSVNETEGAWTLKCSEVIGEVDILDMQQMIIKKCGATPSSASAQTGILDLDPSSPQVVNIRFPALSHCTKLRASELLAHDSFLNNVLNQLSSRSYTVVYSTSPVVRPISRTLTDPSTADLGHSQLFDFEVEDSFPSAMHTDLKRDLRGEVQARANNTRSDAALFERYAFLSPGIFMGVFISLLLLFILYIGMSAISSLEISVAAFSKEMGPAAQKKQQQQQ